MNRFNLIAAALLVASLPFAAATAAVDTGGAADTGKFCIPTRCGKVFTQLAVASVPAKVAAVDTSDATSTGKLCLPGRCRPYQPISG